MMDEPRLVALQDATDPRRCGAKAASLAALIAKGFDVPGGFVVPVHIEPTLHEVEAALAALGTRVAVRSSAVAEDGLHASWAGVFDSFLDVEGAEAVLERVQACRASSGSPRAQAYARDHGDPGAMAVLVQRMVPADAAGVGFSANPVTGDADEVCVHVVRGLGDRLVNGEVRPDEWSVRAGQVEAVATPQGALEASSVAEIAAFLRRIEAAQGHPVDVEWAWSNGRIQLLQARPIVDLPLRPAVVVPPGPWVKDAAHLPGPITPLAEAYLALTQRAAARMFSDWGLLPERMEVRCIAHEPYSCVHPVSGVTPPWWVLAVVVRVVPSLRRKLARAAAAVAAGELESVPRAWEEHGERELLGAIEALRAIDPTALGDADLRSHLEAGFQLAERGQVAHFQLFVPYLVGVHELVRTCERWLGWNDLQALALLQGLSTQTSAPHLALAAIAGRIAEEPGAREALVGARHDPVGGLRAVAPGIASELAGWLERFGFRCVGYDPGLPTLAEQPERVADLLRDLLDQAQRADPEHARQQAITAARGQLESTGRAAFDAALAVAERVYPLREANLVCTDALPGGLVRRAALAVGDRLVQRGHLRRPTDAVYLELHELQAFAAPPGDLAARADRRRREIKWVRAHPGPLTYGPPDAPPPDLRGLPAPARRLNQAMVWAIEAEMRPPARHEGHADLVGIPASAGIYEGLVRVVSDVHDLDRLRVGEVLVCPITTPSWTVYFVRAGALVTDGGSLLSHAAILAREHDIPAVVGTSRATAELRDGMRVRVDGQRGTVTVVG